MLTRWPNVCDRDKQRSVSDWHDFLRSDRWVRTIYRSDRIWRLISSWKRTNKIIRSINLIKSSSDDLRTAPIVSPGSIARLVVRITRRVNGWSWRFSLAVRRIERKTTRKEPQRSVANRCKRRLIELKRSFLANGSMVSRRISCLTFKWMDWMPLSILNFPQV